MESAEEFNRLLVRAILSGGALFLFAGAVLLYFMHGLGKEDRGEKGAQRGHFIRGGALVIVLLLIALYFTRLAFG